MKKKVKTILAAEDYDIKTETIRKRENPLHIAARRGYYNIVEILVNDERYKPFISTKSSITGFTPLDLAKIQGERTLPFIEVTLKNMVLPLIPFFATQKFYSGPLKPYDKTIEILKKHNAKSSCSLIECYKTILNRGIEKNSIGEKTKFSDENKKEAEENLKILETFKSLSEEELSEKIIKIAYDRVIMYETTLDSLKRED